MKWIICLGLYSVLSSVALAALAPVTLSGPIPVVSANYEAGTSQTIIYTLTNNVPAQSFPLTISGISGLVTRTIVSGDCGTVLPAGPSTCKVGINIAPTEADVGSSLCQTLAIAYQGRKPLTSSLFFTVMPEPITLILSGPIPALSVSYTADSTQTLVYTITNAVAQSYPFTITGISGPLSRTTVDNDCNLLIPAGPSTCNIGISIAPTFADVGASINQTLEINYSTGLQLTSPISFTVLPLLGYIADGSNFLWQCNMESSGGFSPASCVNLTKTPAFDIVSEVTLQTFSGVTYGYISDGTQTLWQCPMAPTGGFSGPCTGLTNSPSFNAGVDGVVFHTFLGVTYGYVTDYSNTVWQCPIDNNTGGFSGPCTALSNTPAFTNTHKVTFYDFSGVTYAYVPDSVNILWQCPMNAVGGFAAACTALTNAPPFAEPFQVIFWSVPSAIYAYVAADSDAVWQCTMNATGGFVGPCSALTNFPSFDSVLGMTIKSISGTLYAYVADYSSTLWQCDLNTSGSFSGPCTIPSNSPAFNTTFGITFG